MYILVSSSLSKLLSPMEGEPWRPGPVLGPEKLFPRVSDGPPGDMGPTLPPMGL
jgi:hypothetical protein